MRRLHGGTRGVGGHQKIIIFKLFWPILFFFRVSGVSPIDPARRELQNALGEMKIRDFLVF